MKKDPQSYECTCGSRWQEWFSEGEMHQCFNTFGFIDFKDPEMKYCYKCKEVKDEHGISQRIIKKT